MTTLNFQTWENFSLFKPKMKVTSFIVILAFYYGFVLNYPIVHKIFTLSTDVPDFWFPYTTPVALFLAFIVIFTLLAIPYFIKPFMIVVTISSAIALYAQLTYNVLFDVSMVENVIGTNSSEALFYMNLRSALYILVFGIVPSIFIVVVKLEYRKTWLKELFSRVVLILLALIGLALIAITTYKDFASVGRNNSYLNKMIIPAHVYDTYKYVKISYLTKPLPYTSLGDDAQLASTNNQKPTLVVFVLGETARSMNFSDNGYYRDTQPYTKDLGLISFKDVSSCGTYTALSVPCMFSNMPRTHYSKARANAQDNAVDIIAKAGVKTLWIDNDGGDKGVAKHTQLIKINPNEDPDLCNGETCFDEVMLKHTKQFIQEDNKSKLIVLHSLGSHGPTYFQRFPAQKAKFATWCSSKDIEQCNDQEITNVYDNTLVYTDYFLAQVVKELQQYSPQYNVAMMYMSDHGESLGENGLYLHGTPYAIAPKEQKTVPWLMWVPDQYAIQKNIDVDCLKQQAQQPIYSQDNFFHSLIGFYGVQTKEKRAKMDVFSICHKLT